MWRAIRLDTFETLLLRFKRMLRKSRRYLLLILGLLVVGFFLYRFRNSIALAGFRWSMVGESLRQAHLSLLLLSLATIYVCYAVRALRWVRFCRWLGRDAFLAASTAPPCRDSPALFCSAGPVSRSVPILIARKARTFDSRNVRRLCLWSESSTWQRQLCWRAARCCFSSAAVSSAPATMPAS